MLQDFYYSPLHLIPNNPQPNKMVTFVALTKLVLPLVDVCRGLSDTWNLGYERLLVLVDVCQCLSRLGLDMRYPKPVDVCRG